MPRNTATTVATSWFGIPIQGGPATLGGYSGTGTGGGGGGGWGSGASSADRTYAEKSDMYQSLNRLLTDLETKGEQRVIDEWKTKVTETRKLRTDEAKLEVATWSKLADNKTRLSVAEINAAASDARILAGRRGGAASHAGLATWKEWHKKGTGGADANYDDTDYAKSAQIQGRILKGLLEKNTLPVDHPTRPYLTQRALDTEVWTEEGLKAELGPELWQAYLDGRETPGAEAARIEGIANRIQQRKVTKPDLDAIAASSLKSADIKEEDVQKGTRVESDNEKHFKERRTKLEAELDARSPAQAAALAAAAGRGRFHGLTDEDMGELTSNPGFRRWAKEHGFNELGMMRGDTFVFGRDTERAMRAATAQSKKEVTRIAGEFEGRLGPKAPQMFVLGEITGSKVKTVWAPQADGSVDYIDLDAGTSMTARSASGEWASPALQESYQKNLAENSPGPIGLKGQAPWNVGDVRAQGVLDLNNPELSSEMADFKLPTGTTLRGQRRVATFGEDPDIQASVVQEDGSLIRLRRDDTTSPWRVESGEVYVSPGESLKNAWKGVLVDAADPVPPASKRYDMESLALDRARAAPDGFVDTFGKRTSTTIPGTPEESRLYDLDKLALDRDFGGKAPYIPEGVRGSALDAQADQRRKNLETLRGEEEGNPPYGQLITSEESTPAGVEVTPASAAPAAEAAPAAQPASVPKAGTLVEAAREAGSLGSTRAAEPAPAPAAPPPPPPRPRTLPERAADATAAHDAELFGAAIKAAEARRSGLLRPGKGQSALAAALSTPIKVPAGGSTPAQGDLAATTPPPRPPAPGAVASDIPRTFLRGLDRNAPEALDERDRPTAPEEAPENTRVAAMRKVVSDREEAKRAGILSEDGALPGRKLRTPEEVAGVLSYSDLYSPKSAQNDPKATKMAQVERDAAAARRSGLFGNEGQSALDAALSTPIKVPAGKPPAREVPPTAVAPPRESYTKAEASQIPRTFLRGVDRNAPEDLDEETLRQRAVEDAPENPRVIAMKKAKSDHEESLRAGVLSEGSVLPGRKTSPDVLQYSDVYASKPPPSALDNIKRAKDAREAGALGDEGQAALDQLYAPAQAEKKARLDALTSARVRRAEQDAQSRETQR